MNMITFPVLERFPWLKHGFIPRMAGLQDKSEIRKKHQTLMESMGIPWNRFCFAEQVHAHRVARVGEKEMGCSLPECDGLVTTLPGVALGIHVADCCAIYLVEPRLRAIGLLHSGRRGTEQNIVREGVQRIREKGGSAAKIVAVLSPCIHGCCYDLDFVSKIENQLREEGVSESHRHPDCTGCNPDRYYSYRKEMGKTGRMLAFAMME